MSFPPEIGDSPPAASTTISSEKSAWTMPTLLRWWAPHREPSGRTATRPAKPSSTHPLERHQCDNYVTRKAPA
jgi:hypothetical protein